MASIIRIGCISWLALFALLALLCSFQISSNGLAESFKHLFRKKHKPYDDYDSSWPEDRERRRTALLKAANADWGKFKNSPLFMEPVDDGITQIPLKQLEYEYEAGRKNIALFKEIAKDAIDKRNDFFASARLISKWGFKLITTLIANRREESAIKDRYEPKNFFGRMANALEKLVKDSTLIKREKNYNRDNVDVITLERRTNEILDLAVRVLELSPVGIFLKWDTMKLHMDDPKHPFHKKEGMEEATDLFAQYRAIGYDAAAFMANRVVDLLRLFDKGEIPQSARQII